MDDSFERPFADLAEQVTTRYWGKYRGTVESVEDDEHMGMIRCKVPSVYGDETSPPALPAGLFAGKDQAFLFLPKQGDGVWIEFENGNPRRPIWSGGWWARDEMPAEASADRRVLITPGGLKLIMDDGAKEIQLLHGTKGEITMTDSGITLRFGRAKIELSDSGVAINGTALEVKVM